MSYQQPTQFPHAAKPVRRSNNNTLLIVILVLVPVLACGFFGSIALLLPAVSAARGAARTQSDLTSLRALG